MSRKITRRDFVADSSKIALGAMILPRHVVGGAGYQAPSATLNFAVVGAGGQGRINTQQLMRTENCVAICDVDFEHVERQWRSVLSPAANATPSADQPRQKEQYEKAAKYTNFREMLERQRDIDAVLIATPDHTHAAIAVAAMQSGKHVFVQKPMAWSVYEARLMARVAKETGVVTQMGNQGHSSEGTRRINELIAAGIIGPVKEVHIFTNRPVNYWAQGLPRPGTPITGQSGRGGRATQANPPAAAQPPARPAWNMRQVDRALLQSMADGPLAPPPGMDWDLWLGPAPEIPYHPAYHPFTWRGWVDFGVGALGDMGAHLVDQPYWALGLTQPASVVASSSPWGGGRTDPATYPLATTVQYEYPAVGSRGPVKVFWYDSGLLPPRPPFLPDDVAIPNNDGGGGIFVGEKGILTYGTYGSRPQVWPESLRSAAEAVPQTFPRIEGNHELNWARACKGEVEASSPFEYSAALTETMLLGMVALHAARHSNQNGKKILYDAANMKITNYPDADQFLTREYRKGWEL